MNIPGIPLPLAWLDALGPLVLVIIWVIRQVLVAKAQAKEQHAAEQAGMRPEIDPREEGRPNRGNAKNPDPRNPDARSEVERFLREIGAIADEDLIPVADDPVTQGPVTQEGPVDPFEEPPRRKNRRQPRVERIAEQTSATPAPRAESVATHHLAESQLAEQASHLGKEVALADDRLETRLHEKFDHRLGKLEGRAHLASSQDKPVAPEEPSPAERVAKMLSPPTGVQDAIVLNEILRRPTDRW